MKYKIMKLCDEIRNAKTAGKVRKGFSIISEIITIIKGRIR